jgi:uncharacterized protein (TIGR03083 family)
LTSPRREPQQKGETPVSSWIVTADPTAQTWISALRHSHDRLASLIDAATPEQLTGPSYCKEWTVAQVLSHLGSGAEIFSLLLDAGLSAGEPPGREAFPAIWDSWNGRSPEDQATDCGPVDAAFVERLENLDERELADLHLSMFGMEMDAAGLARMRLSEHALHTWDVAVALDPAAQIDPGAVVLLIDNLGPMASRTGKPSEEPLRVQVTTTDPARALLLEVDDTVVIAAGPGADIAATIELPAEAFVRLVYGRLDSEPPPAGITAAGVDLARLRQVFPGF